MATTSAAVAAVPGVAAATAAPASAAGAAALSVAAATAAATVAAAAPAVPAVASRNPPWAPVEESEARWSGDLVTNGDIILRVGYVYRSGLLLPR